MLFSLTIFIKEYFQHCEHFVYIFGLVKFWTLVFGVEFDSGILEKCHLSIVKNDDMASLVKDHYYRIGDYCSINPGCYKSPPLQEISSRDLKVVEGVRVGFRALTNLLVIVALLDEVNPSR